MANSTSTVAAGGGLITTDFGDADTVFGVTLQGESKIIVMRATNDRGGQTYSLLGTMLTVDSSRASPALRIPCLPNTNDPQWLIRWKRRCYNLVNHHQLAGRGAIIGLGLGSRKQPDCAMSSCRSNRSRKAHHARRPEG